MNCKTISITKKMNIFITLKSFLPRFAKPAFPYAQPTAHWGSHGLLRVAVSRFGNPGVLVYHDEFATMCRGAGSKRYSWLAWLALAGKSGRWDAPIRALSG